MISIDNMVVQSCSIGGGNTDSTSSDTGDADTKPSESFGKGTGLTTE